MPRAVTASTLAGLLAAAACAASSGMPAVIDVEENGIYAITGAVGAHPVSGTLNFDELNFELRSRDTDCRGGMLITGNGRTQRVRVSCQTIWAEFKLIDGKLNTGGIAGIGVVEERPGRRECVEWHRDPKTGSRTCERWEQTSVQRMISYRGAVAAVLVEGQ